MLRLREAESVMSQCGKFEFDALHYITLHYRVI